MPYPSIMDGLLIPPNTSSSPQSRSQSSDSMLPASWDGFSKSLDDGWVPVTATNIGGFKGKNPAKRRGARQDSFNAAWILDSQDLELQRSSHRLGTKAFRNPANHNKFVSSIHKGCTFRRSSGCFRPDLKRIAILRPLRKDTGSIEQKCSGSWSSMDPMLERRPCPAPTHSTSTRQSRSRERIRSCCSGSRIISPLRSVT